MSLLDPNITPFSLEAYYTPTLPESGDRLTAIVAVEAAQSDLMVSSSQERVLLFIIDKSGSMQGEPVEYVKQAVLKGIGALDEATTFAVVAFDETSSVVIPPQPATSAAKKGAESHARLRFKWQNIHTK